MTDIKTVCVYCGGSDNVADVYKDTATELGTLLGHEGIDIVYGGGGVGLMKLMADAAMQAGSKVHGIIPDILENIEMAHTSLSSLDVVDSMHTRKQRMVDRGEAFIILPGGVGTLDEFFEALVWWKLGIHQKPIVLVNINNYWTPLLALLDHIIENGFARSAEKAYLTIVNNVSDIPAALARTPRKDIRPVTERI